MDQIESIDNNEMLMELTAEVVAAYVSNNSLPVAELPALISDVYSALGRTSAPAQQPQAEKPKPAVPVKKSVTDDYIICLEDGKKFKSLKRHLMTHYNLTPEEYREKWDLPADYPMVAPNYAAARSRLAKQMGLGHKRRRGR
ncbi:transcriptional regulator, MucR family [Fulvimarina manganoxydans]|uniref:Transcriptional regulator, MucR family n=1 Tax=Fulvimarina manganoxydans TaxID=937218 RepID=A0A1W2D8T7_9HYPH|nr:MucR family transcriptional regulator [Fulvimarina manganoxydans]MCK5930536.1 MucR family transcriptional regulator [Fulvimarina manganoxydans]MEE2951669.1 MucR family transcriptional regulator [Pseudomonadota bacterium]SMC93815.1 transcriptional regulator, MucR family [Fulvimarina manganoxydans]